MRQLGVALGDVDEVVHDPALGTHHQVEVAQADIEIDHHDLLAALRQRGAQGSGRCGLADPAFAGCHHEYFRHSAPPSDAQPCRATLIAPPFKPRLRGPPEHVWRDVVGCFVVAVDGQKLGFEFAAEDAAVRREGTALPKVSAIGRCGVNTTARKAHSQSGLSDG